MKLEVQVLNIRPMREADLAAVMAIERASMSLAWSQAAWVEELKKVELATHVVAECSEVVIGYAGYWLVHGEANIINVAIHPAWRRRGAGKTLLCALLSLAKSRGAHLATLEVRVSNDAALALYQTLGFDIVAMRKRFYQCPEEDAYVLWLNPIEKA